MVPGLPIGAKNAGLPPSMAMIAYFIPEGELVLLAVGTNARPVPVLSITQAIEQTSIGEANACASVQKL